eukprot:726752-Pelagomonas_calceolata.AAC.1
MVAAKTRELQALGVDKASALSRPAVAASHLIMMSSHQVLEQTCLTDTCKFHTLYTMARAGGSLALPRQNAVGC